MPYSGLQAHAACTATDTDHGDYHCTMACSGFNLTTCPPGLTQFPSPVAGLQVGFSGATFTNWTPAIDGFPYSIVDHVCVPGDIDAGDYLLSWRWDAEQSPQVRAAAPPLLRCSLAPPAAPCISFSHPAPPLLTDLAELRRREDRLKKKKKRKETDDPARTELGGWLQPTKADAPPPCTGCRCLHAITKFIFRQSPATTLGQRWAKAGVRILK